MAKFKKYIEKVKKTKEGYVIVDEPIHLRMDQPPNRTKDGYVIVKDPIHFRMDQPSKKLMKEESQEHHDVLEKLDAENHDMHNNNVVLSKKLHDATAHTLDKHDSRNMKDYSNFHTGRQENGSKRLNMSLAKGYDIHSEDKEMHETIMKHAKASGHEFHLFSGTGRDFKKMHKESGSKIFHLPAHTSATHHLGVAKEFATNKTHIDESGVTHKHMIHIHVKPKDKVLHISKHSAMPEEHETIIPAKTNLEYHGSSVHERKGPLYPVTTHVHHFTVHSQE